MLDLQHIGSRTQIGSGIIFTTVEPKQREPSGEANKEGDRVTVTMGTDEQTDCEDVCSLVNMCRPPTTRGLKPHNISL